MTWQRWSRPDATRLCPPDTWLYTPDGMRRESAVLAAHGNQFRLLSERASEPRGHWGAGIPLNVADLEEASNLAEVLIRMGAMECS